MFIRYNTFAIGFAHSTQVGVSGMSKGHNMALLLTEWSHGPFFFSSLSHYFVTMLHSGFGYGVRFSHLDLKFADERSRRKKSKNANKTNVFEYIQVTNWSQSISIELIHSIEHSAHFFLVFFRSEFPNWNAWPTSKHQSIKCH